MWNSEALETLTLSVCFCCSWKSVADYIDQQFEQYFRDESGLNRKNIQDNRVHCCLYFISPFGHGYDTPAVLVYRLDSTHRLQQKTFLSFNLTQNKSQKRKKIYILEMLITASVSGFQPSLTCDSILMLQISAKVFDHHLFYVFIFCRM